MKKIGWFFRLSNQQPSLAMIQRIAGGIGIAILLMTGGIAAAQNPTPAAPLAGAGDRRWPLPTGIRPIRAWI